MGLSRRLKDPEGGLTAAGRAFYKRTEGANLKPGVKGPANTPEKMKRKGSFLVRMFSNTNRPAVYSITYSANSWPFMSRTRRSTARSSAVPGIWYTVRKTVTDHRGDLPDAVIGPSFNDEFGTTYGNIYAITGDGFSYPVLKRYAETLRDRIHMLPDVAKTQIIGAQDEAIYVTYDSARLAMSGISAQAIADALDTTNGIAASGIVEAGAERVRMQVTGAFGSVEAIGATPIVANGKRIRPDAIEIGRAHV